MRERGPHREHGIWALLTPAPAYRFWQDISGSERAKRELLAKIFPAGSTGRLLDIGCGTASVLDYLPTTLDYVGIDSNARYIEKAKDRYGNRGEFHLMSAAEVDARLGKFDRSLLIGVLHHLDDPTAASLLDELTRCLRPGGELVVIEPVYTEDQPFIERILMGLDRGCAIRTAPAYRKLFSSDWQVRDEVIVPPLRIPWRWNVMRAEVLGPPS